MRNRQNNYQRAETTDLSIMNNRELIYGNNSDKVKQTGQNTIEHAVGYKVYYYDAILRLKDLPFFAKLPLIRGCYMKITMNINQCIFKVTKDANGLLNFDPSTLTLQGGTNPLMVAASVVPTAEVSIANGADLAAGTITTGLQAATIVSKFEACGSCVITVSTTLTASVCVGKNYFNPHSALNLQPLKSQCRLYVPTYTMSPQYEQDYIALGQKTITYTELFTYPMYNVPAGQSFTQLITNGLAKMKRLMVCPFIAAGSHGSDNGGASFSPLVSPFTSEPATCSPYLITQYNVSLGGLQIYPQNVTYNYEMYLNEMNGAYGINANKTTGLCSSRISQIDYNNTYGYLVSDLSRRLPEDDTTAISVSITGTNAGAKALDLMCYVEYERFMTIDLLSGKRLS